MRYQRKDGLWQIELSLENTQMQNNTKAAKVAAPAIQSPSLSHKPAAVPADLVKALIKVRRLIEQDGILVETIANGAGPDTFSALWQLRISVDALEKQLRDTMHCYAEGLRGEIEVLELFEADAFKGVPAPQSAPSEGGAF